jgi:hypothetical protein
MNSGRKLAGGTIQWWNGSTWVSDGTVSGEPDDWGWQFTPEVTTTAIRIYGAHAYHTGGQTSNPIIYEWDVYQCN